MRVGPLTALSPDPDARNETLIRQMSEVGVPDDSEHLIATFFRTLPQFSSLIPILLRRLPIVKLINYTTLHRKNNRKDGRTSKDVQGGRHQPRCIRQEGD